MNNNDHRYYAWEEEGFSPQRENRPRRKVFTWMQAAAMLLIVGLLGGVAGAYVAGGAFNAANAPITDTPALTPAPESGQSGVSVQPSSGIRTGSEQSAFNSTTEMLQHSMASVVGIYIEQTVYNRRGGEASTVQTGSGSGVIITEDGYIVTNNHVVSGVSAVKVYLQDGTQYDGTVVGADSITDLAVVKIEATGLPAAVLGTSANVSVGESVYAIGNPLGIFTTSVSAGIISGLNRSVDIEGQSMTLMQTDASVNPGNSGGGLFNENGMLIGVVNAKSGGANVEGLGFAIPIDDAKPVIKSLIDLGYVSGRPFLGVSLKEIYLTDNSASDGFSFFMPSRYLTRVQVTSVMKGGAADAASILEGDIILSLNGETVESTSGLISSLLAYKIGDVVTITVQRGETTLDLPVTLAERPAKS